MNLINQVIDGSAGLLRQVGVEGGKIMSSVLDISIWDAFETSR